MFDGKTFFPDTGMPMRKIACMSKVLALADPVPFTVPILNAKSLTPAGVVPFIVGLGMAHDLASRRRLIADASRTVHRGRPSIWDLQHELAHVPCSGRTPFCAQTTVETDILVLHHDSFRLRKWRRGIQRLSRIRGRRGEMGAKIELVV